MIDGLKMWVRIEDVPSETLDLLEFPHQVYLQTGEILDRPTVVSVPGFSFTLVPDKGVLIKGSIHKFSNVGLHNHNDFPMSSVIAAVNKFSSELFLDPDKLLIHNIEFGVNIDFTAQLLEELIEYCGKSFNRRSSGNQNYREVVLDRYYLKIYDKGLQFGVSDNLLRYEIKVKAMAHVADSEIRVLSDIKNARKIKILINKLVHSSRRILIGNSSIDYDKLPPGKQRTFLKRSNPEYWIWLKKKRDPSIWQKRKSFRKLIVKYGMLQLSEKLTHAIHSKANWLLEN